MADFEDLRMIDLLQKFRADAQEIYDTKNLGIFRQASAKLQNVYNFYVTAQNDYKAQEEWFKNLFSSFNYAAVIVNDGIKNKTLDSEAKELLIECLQIMLRCCDLIEHSLKA